MQTRLCDNRKRARERERGERREKERENERTNTFLGKQVIAVICSNVEYIFLVK